MSSRSIPTEIHCRHCGNRIDSQLPVCRHCGVRNQYATESSSGSSATPSLGPEHELTAGTQVWKGVKGGVYTMLVGWIVTTILFLLSLKDIIWNLPEVIESIPAVAAATAGGAITASPWVAAAKFFTWVYHGANFVSVSGSGTAGETTRTVTSNVVTEIGSVTSLNPLLFHLTPALLLVYFGYRAARSKGYDEVHENAAAGASVAIGYALVGGLGAMFAGISFGAEFGPSASVGPSLAMSVLIFGGLGVVFGSIGGLLRHYRQSDA